MTAVFSAETELYMKEYDLLCELERIWHEDVNRFFKKLRSRIADERLDIAEQITSGYRYWRLPEWAARSGGGLDLWSLQYDPSLVRDKKMIWHSYVNLSKARREDGNARLIAALNGSDVPSGEGLSIVAGARPKVYHAVTIAIQLQEGEIDNSARMLAQAISWLSVTWNTMKLDFERSTKDGRGNAAGLDDASS